MSIGFTPGKHAADDAQWGLGQVGHWGLNMAGPWWNQSQNSGNAINKFGKSLIPAKSGALSPYAQAQYNQDVGNINNTYRDTVQSGLKSLALRGMGGAPVGARSSMVNTAGREHDVNTTNAYENAQKNTYNEGLGGVGVLSQEQLIHNPLDALRASTGGFSGQAGASANRAQMGGGTLQDIMGGLQLVGGVGSML